MGSWASSQRVWAVTCYFPFDDPSGMKRRLQVYREFRRHLQTPLAAIELSLDGRFDLVPGDADLLLQISAGDLMWQKERLLNHVVAALPAGCDTVAWLDCDVVFLRPDWAEATRAALREYHLVQPFERLFYLTSARCPEPGTAPGFSHCLQSAASLYASGSLPPWIHAARGSSFQVGYAPGMAWAASRDLLTRCQFYDAAILGSGDKFMLSAGCGYGRDLASTYEMTPRFRDHYLAWAEPFAAAVDKRIGAIEGDLYHLWHGDLSARHHHTRYIGFDAFDFDPCQDLALASSGAWRWNSGKPAMHAFVRDFFRRRGEDSARSNEPAGLPPEGGETAEPFLARSPGEPGEPLPRRSHASRSPS